jgi:hypothetical protein
VVSFDGALDFGGRAATLYPLSSGPVRDLQIELYGGTMGTDVEVCFMANAELHTAEALFRSPPALCPIARGRDTIEP